MANFSPVLVVFAAVVCEYSIRTYRRRTQLSESALRLWSSTSFRLFCAAVIVAYLGILIRCIYRIPELIEGWANDLMRDETDFIALEGWMILITVIAQTVFHPGYCFPALASTFGKAKSEKAKPSREGSEDKGDVSVAVV